MFDKTVDNLHDELLVNIDNSYDKMVGSFPYDLTRTVAMEHEKMYQVLDKIVSSMQIENLTGDELSRYTYQRSSIQRKRATPSTGFVTVCGNGVVRVGDLFETQNGAQFKAVSTVTVVECADIPIQSLSTGIDANMPSNQITIMPITLTGITSVNNNEPTSGGYDEESDDELRLRYYERVRTPGTSGNIYHYLSWAKSIVGVGDARIFPLWNGNNTVKVVVVDSEMQPCSEELVKQVQDYIDPDITGCGTGEAPIGAFCTVQSAISKNVNITANIVMNNTMTLEQILQQLQQSYISYLKSISFKSEYVSYAKIGSILLDCDGIRDYSNLLVNGTQDNIMLSNIEVPVLGVINIE